MLKPIIATSLLLVSLFVVASEPLPTIEFIKNGKVIESRMMSQSEYQAYTDLQQMDMEIEVLTAPIEAIEEQIEAKAELIEAEVERVIETYVPQVIEQAVSTTIHGIDSLQSLDNIDIDTSIDMSEISVLIAQIQPQLEQIQVIAEQVSSSANDFKDLILMDYQEGEIDRVRIVDEDDTDNIHWH